MPRKNSNKTYVKDLPLFLDQRIPKQNIYSDKVYWYDQDKLERFWDNPGKGFPKDFLATQNPGNSPSNPLVFSKPPYTENLREVMMHEYEFSRDTIIRTSFSNDISNGSLWGASRDVITGRFRYKNGKIKGTALSILHGEHETQDTEMNNDDYFLFENETGIPVKTFGDMAPFTPTWHLLSAREGIREEFSDIPQGRFFPSGWYNQPFSSNLI